MTPRERNRWTGLGLAGLLVLLIAYSFIVIKARGRLPEPQNLTRVQKVLRGL
jgi:hypothetical protein